MANFGYICHSGVTAQEKTSMGTVRKRGAYQYQAQVRRAGYPAQSATFNTPTDARKWVTATEREMDTGTFLPRGEAQRTTIKDLAKRYLSERVENKMRGERQEVQRVNQSSASSATTISQPSPRRWSPGGETS